MAFFIHSPVRRPIRRPILNGFPIALACLIVLCAAAPLTSAQHPIGRTVGGAGHVSSSPVYHAPVSSAPLRAPIYSRTFRSAGAVDAGFLRPRRPIRPFVPGFLFYGSPFFLGEPFWGFNCWASCDLFWPGAYDFSVSSPGPANYVAQVYETPVYEYGEDAPELPQLYLKDGSILNVTDYWVVDDQLHFTIIQEYGAKPTEEVIPFEALDLQKTIDVNTRRGFRMVLRNEPLDEYVRDHPEGAPPALTANPK